MARPSERGQAHTDANPNSSSREANVHKAYGTRPARAAPRPSGTHPPGDAALRQSTRQTSVPSARPTAGSPKPPQPPTQQQHAQRLPTLMPLGAVHSPRTQPHSVGVAVELGNALGRLKQAGQRKAWGAPLLNRSVVPLMVAVLLRELSSRLCRLDSQKRRVLMTVLQKIDGLREEGGAPGSSGDPGTAASHLLQRSTEAAAGPVVEAPAASSSPRSSVAGLGLLDAAGIVAAANSTASGRSGSGSGENARTSCTDASSHAAGVGGPSHGRSGLAGKLATLKSLGRQPSKATAQDALENFEQAVGAAQQPAPLSSRAQPAGVPAALAAAAPVAASRLAAGDAAQRLGGEGDALDAVLAAGAASAGGSGAESDADFCIPTLPVGRVLELTIHTTWGDPHYVGLAGLELFDAEGQPVAVPDPAAQVTAEPHSINVLPEYGSDPRTPDKLLDGVCLTCDDMHMWLAPFTPGSRHRVTLALAAPVALGALRVWNYNKSRIHALRGVRQVEVTLDGRLIFAGELCQAAGAASADALRSAELLLFTDSPAALATLEARDQQLLAALEAAPSGAPGGVANLLWCSELVLVILDSWGDRHFVGLAGLEVVGADGAPLRLVPGSLWASPPDLNSFPGHSGDCRTLDKLLDGISNTTDDAHMWLAPMRRTLGPGPCPVAVGGAGGATAEDAEPLAAATAAAEASVAALPPSLRQYNLLGVRLTPQACQSGDGSGSSRADSSGSGSGGADDGAGGGGAGAVAVSGLRIHNYNKSLQDTARGVKRLMVLVDGVEVSPPGGLLLRRAPGTAACEFGQALPLSAAWRPGSGSEGRAAAVTSSSSSPSASPATAAERQRSSLGAQRGPERGAAQQQGQLRQSQPSSQSQQQQQQQPGQDQAPDPCDEATAWVCNMPDPLAAAACLARCDAWRRGGALLAAQPADWFASALPCGFRLKLVLLSSWGDPHYVGLCGIEVVDAARGPLALRPSQICACEATAPSSVAALPGMAADARTPDKLVDGDTSGAPAHSWLAPLAAALGRAAPEGGRASGACAAAPAARAAGSCAGAAEAACGPCNVVEVALDAPALLGALRVWNYARTPARGAREAEVYLDEQLVWKGLLQRAPEAPAPGQDFSQLLPFSEEATQAAAAAAQRRAPRTVGGAALPPAADAVAGWLDGHDVLLFNEGQAMGGGSGPGSSGGAAGAAAARPVTAVVC
eukprot:scaffold5.g656.t1